MKTIINNLIIIILFIFLSSDALALVNSSQYLTTEAEAAASCDEHWASTSSSRFCTRISSTKAYREVYSEGSTSPSRYNHFWQTGNECVSPNVINLSTGTCDPPAPEYSQACADRNGDGSVITWSIATTSSNCSDNCEYTFGMALCGTNTCSAVGIEWTGMTCYGTVDAGTPGGAPDGCVTGENGDIVCVGENVDTYNGNPLPDGDLPDNSCEYLSDGSFVCDQPVGDTSNGNNTQELQDDNNPAYPQTVHNDYTSLPPGTGVDTNGDGVTDALTQDTTGDGITDNIINADGTDFLTTDQNGTVDDTPNQGTINDDGTYNDGESQTAGNEDGTGEGLGECTDDPGTPEDECGDINKSGATTPYCDAEPTCEGDPLQCAQIFQLWQNLCVWDVPETMTGSLLVDEPGVDDGSSFFNEATDVVDLSTFDLNDTGWGYARSCPSDIQITNSFGTFTVALSDYCGLFEVMSYFVLLLGALISGRIFVMGIA
jgi:hypothetical protein